MMRRVRALRAAIAVILVVPPAAAAQSPVPAAAPTLRGLTTPQDDYPDVSPDGRRIVFQSNRSGSWQLWIMNRDGTGLQRLTHGNANDRTPAWSPDGSRILFSSDRRTAAAGAAGASGALASRDIFVMDVAAGLDGAETRVRRLLESPTQDIHPKWTRDGRAIVFNRVSASGERGGAEVWMMDADGRNPRRIPLPAGINTYASLAPDGSRLVYRGTTREAGSGAENSDIFSAAPDGSARRRLTDDATFEGWPAISPDGGTIAFASRRTDDRYHLFLMPIEGGTPRQITFGAVHHYTQPAWTPDGRQITAYRWTLDRAAEVGHIVLIDLDPRGP